MAANQPGGEFAGAWAALAAARTRTQRHNGANTFPGYSTAELQRDLRSPVIEDATRAKIEAEISRRLNKRRA